MGTSLQTISFVILDENEPAIHQLEELLQNNHSFHKIATFSNSINALEYLQCVSCDVLFISSKLSILTAPQFIRLINSQPLCVFLGDEKEEAYEAYEAEAMGFLLKPIRSEQLHRALKRIENYLQTKEKVNRYNVIQEKNTIIINQGHDAYKIDTSKILFIQALKDYSKIITSDKNYLTLHNLKHFLGILDSKEFIRVHRSFAVSMKNITSLEHDLICIHKYQIPIGKTYKKPIHELFKKSVYVW